MSTHQDRTVLITGAAKRIGRAVALRAAAAGMDVVARLGRRIHLVSGDLSSPEAAESLVEESVRTFGSLSALVNSASTFHESGLMDFTLEALEGEIRVNAFSPLVLARALSATASDGCIVNLLDSRVNSYDATHVAYHLSKRMLYSVTRMLAVELAPRIRVNAVAPGLILPPPGHPESYLETHKSENPLKCSGSPEGVADAVQFLIDSDFITGQVIYVDGGRHLNSAVYG
jgi:pteridine reductase